MADPMDVEGPTIAAGGGTRGGEGGAEDEEMAAPPVPAFSAASAK